MVRAARTDHTHSLEKAEEAARAEFDEVLFDGSASSFEEKLAQTRRAVVVHINTDLRLAWRRGLESALARDPDAVTPYKILMEPLRTVKRVVRSRLELFQGQREAPRPGIH